MSEVSLSGVRILVVDDEVSVARAVGRTLRGAGAAVDETYGIHDARLRLREGAYAIVVTDIDLAGDDGVDLLRAARLADPDTAVVLMTGKPELRSAVEAVNFGAHRYLVKPLSTNDIRSCAREALTTHRASRLRREALALLGALRHPPVLPTDAGQLNRALATLHMVYQPIVGPDGGKALAYEALVRTREPGLNPEALFSLAEGSGRVIELGRIIRNAVAADLVYAPPEVSLYVNLHCAELTDEELFTGGTLAKWSRRIVLEITERAALTNLADAAERIARLRDRGFRIAIDDLGAGYAGLTSFAIFCPDVAKIDLSLIRGLDGDPLRRHIVRTLAQMCAEMGVLVVAEGIETAGEHAAAVESGCDMLQGYRFGRPMKAFAG